MKKKSTRIRLLIALTWTIVVFMVGYCVSSIAAFERFWPGRSDTQQLSDEDISALQSTYDAIQSMYIEEVDKEQIMVGALKGMVNSLDDPYSEFLNHTEMEAVDDSIEGSFQGVGIQFVTENDYVTVISSIEDTPASRASIQPNDIILKADGTELKGLSTNEIVDMIRGPEGTEVTLTILRGETEFDVTLKRAEIPIVTVKANLDEQDATIGYVQVTQFNGTTYDEMVEAITQLREEGAERFVFDFRYNPGGLLDQALAITNMFLEDDEIIMQMEEAGVEPLAYQAKDAELGDFQVTEPYVMLINEGSASASEILAGAIQQNTDQPLVGEQTFGKGTVQTVFDENEYGELKLTVAKWLTPDGTWIHEEGVAPDVEVESHPINKAILLNPEDSYEEGAQSEQVTSIITILDALGYDVREANFYDTHVSQAVKSFQADHDLAEDGIVSGETTSALMQAAREYIEEHDQQYDKAVEVLNGQVKSEQSDEAEDEEELEEAA